MLQFILIVLLYSEFVSAYPKKVMYLPKPSALPDLYSITSFLNIRVKILSAK